MEDGVQLDAYGPHQDPIRVEVAPGNERGKSGSYYQIVQQLPLSRLSAY